MSQRTIATSVTPGHTVAQATTSDHSQERKSPDDHSASTRHPGALESAPLSVPYANSDLTSPEYAQETQKDPGAHTL